MALSLSPHCLTVPGEPDQRDAHQEGRSPEGAGPEEVEGPHKEESSSSGDQSSLEALVGAGPEHLGTGLWGVGVVPVGRVQLPGSQAVVVMGALGQEGQCLVAVAATAAAAASGAAPAKNKSGERYQFTAKGVSRESQARQGHDKHRLGGPRTQSKGEHSLKTAERDKQQPQREEFDLTCCCRWKRGGNDFWYFG